MIISKKKELQFEIFKKGLTNQEFAQIVGISSNMLSLIINGHKSPGPKTAKKIVEFLEVEFEELFELGKSE